MANPQPKHFVKFSIELFEAFMTKMPWKISDPVLIFLAIMRETYGFGRKSAEISIERFRVLTGINDRSNLNRAIKRATASNIITVVTSDHKKHPTYSIQKDYEKWSSVVTSDHLATVVTSDHKIGHQRPQNRSPVTRSVCYKIPLQDTFTRYKKTPLTPTGGTLVQHNPKKTKFTPPTGPQIKANGNPWIDPEAWDDFLQHRLDIKKPLSPLGVKKSIDLLSEHRTRQREIIDTAIRCRWQGLFAPKGKIPTADDVDGPRLRILEAPPDAY
jgi:hypothetical protein